MAGSGPTVGFIVVHQVVRGVVEDDVDEGTEAIVVLDTVVISVVEVDVVVVVVVVVVVDVLGQN